MDQRISITLGAIRKFACRKWPGEMRELESQGLRTQENTAEMDGYDCKVAR